MPEYKYNEPALLSELQAYVDATYTQHYGGNIQALEFISDQGHGVGFLVGAIIKYAARYGKKEGYNRKDLMKIAHYVIMLLNEHDKGAAKNPVKLDWCPPDFEGQDRAKGVGFDGSGLRWGDPGFSGMSGLPISIARVAEIAERVNGLKIVEDKSSWDSVAKVLETIPPPIEGLDDEQPLLLSDAE